MSDTAHAPATADHGAGHGAGHGGGGHAHTNYVKIWGILLALLVVSVLGPMLEIRVVTLITAFGIAVVKAYIVVKYFMHIGIEKKYVGYLLATMIALMVLMVGGISPDVLKHDGARWENVAAKKVVTEGQAKGADHGDAHGKTPEAAPAAH